MARFLEIQIVLVVVVVLIGSAAQADTVVIPLDQIWALDMPGTKPIRMSLPKEVAPESQLLRGIRWKLTVIGTLGPKTVGPGFAVAGTDLTALRKAYTVFVEGKAHTKRFVEGSEVAIAFFSRSCEHSARLSKVTRDATNVKLFYHFVPFRPLMSADTFALVPLGEIPQGTYHVEILEIPMREKDKKRGDHPLAPGTKKGFVSESFSFVVDEPGDR